MKKLAALVLVLILCFSVSIGGTYAIQNGATGPLASEVFMTEENLPGIDISLKDGARVKLVPGSTVTGKDIVIKNNNNEGIVLVLKFISPTLKYDNSKLIEVTHSGSKWASTTEADTYQISIPKNGSVDLGDFNFKMDSRIDVEDGKVVSVVDGKIYEINWNGLEKSYIKIEATTRFDTPTNP